MRGGPHPSPWPSLFLGNKLDGVEGGLQDIPQCTRHCEVLSVHRKERTQNAGELKALYTCWGCKRFQSTQSKTRRLRRTPSAPMEPTWECTPALNTLSFNLTNSAHTVRWKFVVGCWKSIQGELNPRRTLALINYLGNSCLIAGIQCHLEFLISR